MNKRTPQSQAGKSPEGGVLDIFVELEHAVAVLGEPQWVSALEKAYEENGRAFLIEVNARMFEV